MSSLNSSHLSKRHRGTTCSFRDLCAHCNHLLIATTTLQAISKALGAFNGDPEVRVMLMPAKTAAAGLTLTAASRVILLEPAADPAVPQQVHFPKTRLD